VQVLSKKIAADEAWRSEHQREERKKRYVQQGLADRKADFKKQRTDD
jgi:hypothetical protein